MPASVLFHPLFTSKMQSILRWSIENSTPQDNAPVVRENLDPGIIDHILGKPDSEQMKVDLVVAIDSNKSEEERVEALDHLEMVRGMATINLSVKR